MARPVGRPGLRGAQDGGHHRRGPAQQGHAVLLHPAQDVLAVDLAQHDVGAPHARDGIGHAPPIAVEHRQRVQQDVAVADPGVPAEGGGVQPAVSLGQLHPLGPCRRPRGVVHRARRVLVGRPGQRGDPVGSGCEEGGIVAAVEAEAVGDLDGLDLVGQIGVVQEDRRPGMLHHIGDLVGGQAEIDRHQRAAVATDPEVGRQEPTGVRADDRNPLAVLDPEVVERQGHTPGAGLELTVGEGPEGPWHGRLVHHGCPVPVDQGGPVEKVGHRECDPHATPNLCCCNPRSAETLPDGPHSS